MLYAHIMNWYFCLVLWIGCIDTMTYIYIYRERERYNLDTHVGVYSVSDCLLKIQVSLSIQSHVKVRGSEVIARCSDVVNGSCEFTHILSSADMTRVLSFAHHKQTDDVHPTHRSYSTRR